MWQYNGYMYKRCYTVNLVHTTRRYNNYTMTSTRRTRKCANYVKIVDTSMKDVA